MVQFVKDEPGDNQRACYESCLNYICDTSIDYRAGVNNELMGSWYQPSAASFTSEAANPFRNMQAEYLEDFSALGYSDCSKYNT